MITSLLVASIIFIIIGAILLGINSLSYGIGLFVGAINSLFHSFQYIGASCNLINAFQYMFYIGVPVFLVLYFRNHLKD